MNSKESVNDFKAALTFIDDKIKTSSETTYFGRLSYFTKDNVNRETENTLVKFKGIVDIFFKKRSRDAY